MSNKPYLEEQKNYPLWYHNRPRDSDGKLIQDWMYFIPYDLKPEVSDKYERIYQSGVEGFRGKANTYLHGEALKQKEIKDRK